MKLGKLGVWAFTDGMTAAAAAAFAQRVESWGYSALWLPETFGRNVLVHSSWLLANTRRLIIATGIANIYARDATAMATAQMGLNEQSGGRFLLGIGASHGIVAEMRGYSYDKPVEYMSRYLDAMAKSPYMAPPPAEKPGKVIAALGPKMLAVAAEKADGAHPYNVTPIHTAMARKALGKDKWLYPEQMVLLETDPTKARAIARKILALYLGLPNYRNNFIRQGFSEADVDNGGSDRLIDAAIAWGDEEAIRARLQEHWDAGADHVCIQPLHPSGEMGALDEKVLELLAPAKGG